MADPRVHPLNDKPLSSQGGCVLYVMARDQRLQDNFALATAQRLALQAEVPLAVLFCLQPRTGYRAREHYQFMLDGLRELEIALSQRNIPLMLLLGQPGKTLRAAAHHLKPRAIIFDFSPLRGPQQLRKGLAAESDCLVAEVDTHNIVPIWQASDHQEIAARTLRPKLNRQLAQYLEPAPEATTHPYAWPGTVQPLGKLQSRIDELLAHVEPNNTDISRFQPGEKAAQKALENFVRHRLEGYSETRNDPSKDGQSELSPYLHFGQLSAATVVRAVQAAGTGPDAEALIEELVVRKELSDNFCYYNGHYTTLAGAPQWARTTLEKHAADPREFTYGRQQFEAAKTHDEAWNAAQRQLISTGKIHGYMRMYWAKKVLEWSVSPQEALETLLYLNDHYHLDGGDPNGYVGILWSIAGLHDRPWGERPVYGTVRSMVYSGLKRKFDIAAYIARFPPE